jgi:hypothetical protein
MSCCNSVNEKEPCGLPPGTIRSTMGLLIVIVGYTVLSFLAIYFVINKEYSNALGIGGMLATTLGSVVGFYFGSRGKQELHQEVQEEVRKNHTMINLEPINDTNLIKTV